MRNFIAKVMPVIMLVTLSLAVAPRSEAAGRLVSASDTLSTLKISADNATPSPTVDTPLAGAIINTVVTADMEITVEVTTGGAQDGTAFIQFDNVTLGGGPDVAIAKAAGAATVTLGDSTVADTGVDINWNGGAGNLVLGDIWHIYFTAASAATATIDLAGSNDGDVVIVSANGGAASTIFEDDSSTNGVAPGNIAFDGTNAGLVTQVNASGLGASLTATPGGPGVILTWDTVGAAGNGSMTIDRVGGAVVVDNNNGANSWVSNPIADSGNAGGTVATHDIQFNTPTALAAGNIVKVSLSATSATAGYQESAAPVTDKLVIVTGTNGAIVYNEDGATPRTVNLVTQGGLVSGTAYTGDAVAAAIATALNAGNDADDNDVYTATYNEDTDRFTITNTGWDANDNILWTDVGSTAAATLGYTADDNAASMVGDNAVAFNIITGTNNTVALTLDGIAGAADVTVAPGVYTAATLAAAIETAINATVNFDADPISATPTAYVTYTGANKFRVTSALTGATSTVAIAAGATDMRSTVSWTALTTIAGAASSNSGFRNLAAAGVTVNGSTNGVISAAGALTDASGDGFNDTITWTLTGIAPSNDTITFVGGSISATNPTAAGLYQINLSTLASDGSLVDNAAIAVYVVNEDSVTVSATVDPLLAFEVNGTDAAFGTLDPNAYHKLVGSKSAYGYIDITTANAADGETVTVRTKTYEFDNNDSITTGNIGVDINAVNSYETALNLYRAINNADSTFVRANVATPPSSPTTRIYVVAKTAGANGNAYALAETGAAISVSGANLANGIAGNNWKDDDDNAVLDGDESAILNGATGTNLVVSTNSASGYVLTVENTGLFSGANQIADWVGGGSYGYGIAASAQSARYGDGTGDGTSELIKNSYNSIKALPGGVPTTLASYGGTAAGDNVAVDYWVRIDADQAAGEYTDTVTYIATATY